MFSKRQTLLGSILISTPTAPCAPWTLSDGRCLDSSRHSPETWAPGNPEDYAGCTRISRTTEQLEVRSLFCFQHGGVALREPSFISKERRSFRKRFELGAYCRVYFLRTLYSRSLYNMKFRALNSQCKPNLSSCILAASSSPFKVSDSRHANVLGKFRRFEPRILKPLVQLEGSGRA